MSKISEAKQRADEKKNSVFFKSNFKHLNAHNGFRCGELHTFIAEKGGGKSTLIRAWIIEILAQGKKVYVRLSEEYAQSYRDEILTFFSEQHEQILDNLIIDSELELSPSELGKDYVASLNARVIRSNAHILILDNFTTSALSRVAPLEQELASVELRRLAHDSDIPVIIAAHTEKGFNKTRGVATGDNIRGNMTLANTAAYIYTLTIFHALPTRPSILLIDKARHHTNANKKFFLLNYNASFGSYTSDAQIEPSEIKNIIKESMK
jgi:hypothetical protein